MHLKILLFQYSKLKTFKTIKKCANPKLFEAQHKAVRCKQLLTPSSWHRHTHTMQITIKSQSLENM